MNLQPYEPNDIVFIDTEFTDLDPYKGEILSIGIVKLGGEELYIELEQPAMSSEWVKSNILPMLTQTKVSVEDAVQQIREFLITDNTKPLPYAVAFVDNYDVIYLTKLFGVGGLPFNWMTVDFASVLFSQGVDPASVLKDNKSGGKKEKGFYRSLGIDLGSYHNHHALDDAKLLREAWLKITNKSEGS